MYIYTPGSPATRTSQVCLVVVCSALARETAGVVFALVEIVEVRSVFATETSGVVFALVDVIEVWTVFKP